MANIFFLTAEGTGLGIGLRLEAERHKVGFWLRTLDDKSFAKGLLKEAKSCERLVVADSTGFGPILDALREGGRLATGGCSFADELENDRKLTEDILHDAGIDTPLSKRVDSLDGVKEFYESVDSEKIVVKPEGNLSGDFPSRIAHDIDDAAHFIEELQAETSSDEMSLLLQEFVEGTEITTEGWFNGSDWIPQMFEHSIERKQTMAGDIGPDLGCTGNIVWPAEDNDPLVSELMLPLTDVLRRGKYNGSIDLSCIVNEKGVYALEFTPRFGYDSTPTFLYGLYDFDFGEFLEACAMGKMPSVTMKHAIAGSVRLFLDKDKAAGTEIRGLTKEELQWFYPYCVSNENGIIRCTGNGGDIGVLVGVGDTVGEAYAHVYGLAEKLRVPGLRYRNDFLDLFSWEYRRFRQLVHGDSPEWVAFDLDGTLAEYHKRSDDIGKPVPKMIKVIKDKIASGENVRILTARGTLDPGQNEQLLKIHAWVKEHIGTPLEVTDRKDPDMKVLYDDRVIPVIDGEPVEEIEEVMV